MRSFLKAETAELHHRVEARYATIFDTDVWSYRRFLSATARAIFPLENAVSQANNPHINWQAHSRTAVLAADLAELEIDLPAPNELPAFGGEAFVFGILYVLEGSRNGARQHARAALASPSARVRAATRYLSHGQSQRLWPAFVERLEVSLTVRDDPDETARGAKAAFHVFELAADDLTAADRRFANR